MKMKLLLLFLICSTCVLADIETPQPQNIETVEYVIIGAGTAGIFAANTFAASGKSSVILEARNRIGGRVDTVFVEGYPVAIEKGASFVHDSLISPWPPIAAEAGYELRFWDDYDIQFIEDGRRLNDNTGYEILGEFSYYWEGHFNYSQLGRSDREALFLAGYVVPQRRIEAVLAAVETIPALNMEDHDSTGWNPYPTEELGETYIIPGGYKQLLEYVFYNYTLASQGLRLRSEVRKIDYTNPQGSVIITYKNLESGKLKQIKATKGVVVTLPMGVLKACVVEFAPPLPVPVQYSINKVSFGNAMKVALFFDDRTMAQLRDNHNWYWVIPQEANTDAIVVIWNYAFVYGQPILQSFFTGDFSIYMETLSDQQILNYHMRELRQFLPRLPDPEKWLITRWHSDPYARGVYADYSLGTTTEDFSRLLNPIGTKGTVMLAGEHVGTWTDSIELDQGTTNQAARTGTWAAEYLLSLDV